MKLLPTVSTVVQATKFSPFVVLPVLSIIYGGAYAIAVLAALALICFRGPRRATEIMGKFNRSVERVENDHLHRAGDR